MSLDFNSFSQWYKDWKYRNPVAQLIPICYDRYNIYQIVHKRRILGWYSNDFVILCHLHICLLWMISQGCLLLRRVACTEIMYQICFVEFDPRLSPRQLFQNGNHEINHIGTTTIYNNYSGAINKIQDINYYKLGWVFFFTFQITTQ